MTSRKLLGEGLFLLATVVMVLPLWSERYLPLQDLPQHLAAITVLHHYSDEALRLHEYFTLAPFRTQYLAYYLIADVLAYPLGVELANRVLMSVSIAALPYATRSLLRARGSNEDLALLTLPLIYNAHLILGFLNFLAAIPLSLWVIALSMQPSEQRSLRRLFTIAALLVVTFYTHVIPFAFAALGFGVLSLRRPLLQCIRGLWPLVPSTIASVLWLMNAPAGQATVGAATGSAGSTLGPSFRTTQQAWDALPMWMTDVLRGDQDDSVLARFTLLLAAAWALGFASWVQRSVRERQVRVGWGVPTWWLWWLPILSVAAYFVLPESYDWIWPIAPRFALLSAVFAIAMLPRMHVLAGRAIALLALLLSLSQVRHVSAAFAAFAQDEVAELDAALATIPTGQRVAGLIFDRGSRHVKFSPFIHAVAHYQAQKGGAVMFTFADFPQSPFAFRPELRPPPVGPRWEWMPERVRPSRDLTWYDYVLVRGGPGVIQRETTHFRPVFRGPHWSVWQQQR